MDWCSPLAIALVSLAGLASVTLASFGGKRVISYYRTRVVSQGRPTARVRLGTRQWGSFALMLTRVSKGVYPSGSLSLEGVNESVLVGGASSGHSY